MKITKDYIRQLIRESLEESNYDYAGLSAGQAAFIGRLARTAHKLHSSGGDEVKERELWKLILYVLHRIGPTKFNNFLMDRVAADANNTPLDKQMYRSLIQARDEARQAEERNPKFASMDWDKLHGKWGKYLE